MVKKKYSICLIIFTLSTLITGCAGLSSNRVEWDKLEERKIFLTEFQYVHLDDDTKSAFNDIKNIPVKKIMYALAREYNIEIDISDFNKFIKTKNTSAIKTDGFLRDKTFTWHSPKTDIKNRIVITHEKDFFDESKMNLKVTAYSDGRILRTINISFSKIDYIFVQLKFTLSHADEIFAEYDKNDFENKNTIPGLIISYVDSAEIVDESTVSEIKLKLENHVKSLNQEQKDTFKHEMIDYIYKICK